VAKQIGWLDVAGFLEGNQKSSFWVDILRHYERHFAEYKDLDIEILEIGVLGGSSLAIWKQYFTRARFIGVDINPACKRLECDRVAIEIGSQDDPEFLLQLTRKYRPTIIIDDGSHLGHHIPFTFERLFPSLPPGGLYVIEDMFFHFLPKPNSWLGYSDVTSPDYLFDIVRLLFTEPPDPAKNHGIQGFLRKTIDEIAFAPLGAAFIRRKSIQAPIDDRVSWAEEYARKENKASVWRRVADYVQRNGGPLDRAARAAQKAVEMDPLSAACHATFAQVLRSQGDLTGALVEGGKAADLEPSNWANYNFLGQLYFSVQDYVSAEQQFRKAAALNSKDPAINQRLKEAIKAQGRAAE